MSLLRNRSYPSLSEFPRAWDRAVVSYSWQLCLWGWSPTDGIAFWADHGSLAVCPTKHTCLDVQETWYWLWEGDILSCEQSMHLERLKRLILGYILKWKCMAKFYWMEVSFLFFFILLNIDSFHIIYPDYYFLLSLIFPVPLHTSHPIWIYLFLSLIRYQTGFYGIIIK